MLRRKATRNARKLPPAAPTHANPPRAPRRSWRGQLRAWRDQHLFSLFSSLGRLAARPWATGLTVLVLGFALALPLLFFLVFDNARGLSGGLREAREITVFLKPAIDTAAASLYAGELGRRGDVAGVVLRTPEQGLAEFRQLSGFSEALDALQTNPLPSVLVVTPTAVADIEHDPSIIGDLRSDPRVDLVQYDAVWRRRLGAILGFGERSVEVFAAILALATLLVIGNTVRLDIQGRAEEIAVMQLIGAGNGFVRRPFLYTGLWYGLLGGLLAVLAVGVVELALAAPLGRLLASYDHRFALHGLDPVIALALIGAGALLGWFGAFIVSTRHLMRGLPGS
ncbi:MAG TPA: permease-like cell division protein FtsX [Rhodanobacteraceae bacterium]|nr:permease-like cell division protein FtsX [Rhodanobacteraceae bacterium]